MTDAAIWADPARMSGKPCLHSTRIPVATVVHMVAHAGIDDFQRGYGPIPHRTALVACAWWCRFMTPEDRYEVAIGHAWRRWVDDSRPYLSPGTDAAAADCPHPPLVPLPSKAKP